MELNQRQGSLAWIGVAINDLILRLKRHTHSGDDGGLIPSSSVSGLTTAESEIDALQAIHSDSCEPTGFADRTKSTIAFTVAGTGVNQTRTFAIDHQTDATFDIYSGGTKYSKTHDTVAIPDVTGLYYVYYSTAGVLTCSAANTAWDIKSAAIPVATVYWNADLDEGIVGDERHGIQMDGMTHEYLHETKGAAYAYGLGGTFATNGSTLSISSGEWYDDDIEWKNASALTQCRVLYRDAAAKWKWSAAQNGYFTTTSSVPAYDNGSGTLAQVGVAKWSVSWVFITNDPVCPIHVVMGQAEYNTQALAEAVGPDSLSIGTLPFAEMLLLYRVVWQRNGAVIAKASAADYRRLSGGPVSNYTATDHAALSHLDAATSGHTGFALTGDIPTRDTLGLDTDDSPQFAGVNIGHASDTTLTREATGYGDLAVEGQHLVRIAGTQFSDTLANMVSTEWLPFGDGGELGIFPHAPGFYRASILMVVTAAGTAGATAKFSITAFIDGALTDCGGVIPMCNSAGTMMTAGACPLTSNTIVFQGSRVFYTYSGTAEDASGVNISPTVTANGATANVFGRLEYLGA